MLIHFSTAIIRSLPLCILGFVVLSACSSRDLIQALHPVKDSSASANASTYPCAIEATAKLNYETEQVRLDQLLQDTAATSSQALAIEAQQKRVDQSKSLWLSEKKKCRVLD